MSAKSDYLETAIIDHVLRNTVYTSPVAVYCALFTVAPTESGVSPNYGGTEVSGNNYARTAVTFGAPSGGACSNNAPVNFPQATGVWGNIVAFAIIDNAVGGNMLYFGNFTTPKQVNNTDILSILTGQLTIGEL